jgi:uncharacterized protein (DUF2267 family)
LEAAIRSETEASKALDRMSNGFRMNPQSAQDEVVRRVFDAACAAVDQDYKDKFFEWSFGL